MNGHLPIPTTMADLESTPMNSGNSAPTSILTVQYIYSHMDETTNLSSVSDERLLEHYLDLEAEHRTAAVPALDSTVSKAHLLFELETRGFTFTYEDGKIVVYNPDGTRIEP